MQWGFHAVLVVLGAVGFAAQWAWVAATVLGLVYSLPDRADAGYRPGTRGVRAPAGTPDLDAFWLGHRDSPQVRGDGVLREQPLDEVVSGDIVLVRSSES